VWLIGGSLKQGNEFRLTDYQEYYGGLKVGKVGKCHETYSTGKEVKKKGKGKCIELVYNKKEG